jgi:signal transduction histidine kinase
MENFAPHRGLSRQPILIRKYRVFSEFTYPLRMNLLQRLFSTSEFMPHGMCYEWDPRVIWLHVLSDGFIALAYYSIPLTLVYFVRKRKDLVFDWMFVCFAVFIIACGTTHIMEIVNIWHPTYWLSGVIKAFTALVSVATAILLIRILPFALALPSPEQLRKSNEALQGEIEERKKAASKIESLNGELVRQSSNLENANKELESFSYSVSHDLRAPLRAMLGFSEALRTEFSANLPEQARDYISRIGRGAERLDRLTSDLLAYSRITTLEIITEPVDLDRLIREVILEYPDLQSQSSHITIQGKLPRVLGWASGLAQITANLLGNGIKFAKPGESPVISIRAETSARPGFARIWFEDKGIGISASNQQRIFNIFEQINPPSVYGGTGIGLAVVKKTIERMRGSVGVESAEGGGSRFWIELPLAKEA